VFRLHGAADQDVLQREMFNMVCRNCKLELPVYASYCPSCGIQVHKPHAHHAISNTTTTDQEVHARHVDWLFEPVYHAIEQRMDESNVDKTELFETARRIEAEVLKGETANAEKVTRWLRLYQEVAPDIMALTVSVLQKPDAGVSQQIHQTTMSFANRSDR
jgi:hypothetical protein